jgi:hypothetical protein
MTDIDLVGYELTTLNGTRTYEVIENDEDGNIVGQTTMSEPFFVKGICKTASIITYTDEPLTGPVTSRTEPYFNVYYARTANGFPLLVGQEKIWELISFKSTPYGQGYKNETNWRSVPSDLFKTT